MRDAPELTVLPPLLLEECVPSTLSSLIAASEKGDRSATEALFSALYSVSLLVAAFFLYLSMDNGSILAVTCALAALATLAVGWIRNWSRTRTQKDPM